MNIVKLQDIKLIPRNSLNSYTITVKNQKKKFKETITFTITMKRIKCIEIKLPKKRPIYRKLQNTDKMNQR